MFELPFFLQQLITERFETLAAHNPQARQQLQRAVAALSHSYLKGSDQGHLQGDLAILAYLSARLPATYAVGSACLQIVKHLEPQWQPDTLVDLGAGPGSMSLAALAYYQPRHHVLYEADARMIQAGKAIFAAGNIQAHWHQGYLPQLPTLPVASGPRLWLAGYVLNELSPAHREKWYARLQSQWQPEDRLLLIEPGTPRGYQHILEARTAFLAQGNSVGGPCPHQQTCPLPTEDWCHFSERLPRSPLHRYLKGGERNFEDEKYAYLWVSPQAVAPVHAARLLREPRHHKGHMQLRLCTADGVKDPVVGKKNPAYKTLKKSHWGDGLDAKTLAGVLS